VMAPQHRASSSNFKKKKDRHPVKPRRAAGPTMVKTDKATGTGKPQWPALSVSWHKQIHAAAPTDNHMMAVPCRDRSVERLPDIIR
jgi:hypothetical protein